MTLLKNQDMNVRNETQVTSIIGNLPHEQFQTMVQRENTEIADLFAGADVGLALFDAQLSLLACNDL
jgi:hypothetical protein